MPDQNINTKSYICTVCGWVYDPALGVPELGIAPDTAFEDLDADFLCPLCHFGADKFQSLPAA